MIPSRPEKVPDVLQDVDASLHVAMKFGGEQHFGRLFVCHQHRGELRDILMGKGKNKNLLLTCKRDLMDDIQTTTSMGSTRRESHLGLVGI